MLYGMNRVEKARLGRKRRAEAGDTNWGWETPVPYTTQSGQHGSVSVGCKYICVKLKRVD